jgi:hypothetical protein
MSVARKKGPKGHGRKPSSPPEDPSANRSTPARPDEMDSDVIEFIQAIDHYKRVQQRPFPSWSEVLEVLKSLGWSKAL